MKLAKAQGLEEVFVHGFLDGRDVGPRTSIGYIEETEKQMKEIGVGKFASISGRYYAMDRDRRWERVELAYRCTCGRSGADCRICNSWNQHSYEEDV